MSSQEGQSSGKQLKSRKKKQFVPHDVKRKPNKKSNEEIRLEELKKQSISQLSANQAFKQLISSPSDIDAPRRIRRLSKGAEQNGIKYEGLQQSFEEYQDETMEIERDIKRTQISDDRLDEQNKEQEAKRSSLLDYTQVYPTKLPLRMPEEEAAVIGMEGMDTNFIPQDLFLQPDRSVQCELSDSKEGELQVWQFPAYLPLHYNNKVTKITDIEEQAKVGKLMTYESGRKTLLLNDIEFDVSTGSVVENHQNVALLNIPTQTFCHLGEVTNRFVCIPNVECLLRQQLEQTSTDHQ
eukprot:TRINITY_DN14442_c0_g1_i1.p1 TRINITY_DN14442_c0_g1~~TRINITY_DN14442_c0_g1_i1.p1  ORF type:complete len:295 (-),score=28.52 TRINITY_DN14442_c0_g1_i1:117-1001(-)